MFTTWGTLNKIHIMSWIYYTQAAVAYSLMRRKMSLWHIMTSWVTPAGEVIVNRKQKPKRKGKRGP